MRSKILLAILALVVIGAIFSIFYNKKIEVEDNPEKPLITVQSLNTTPINSYPHDTSSYTEGLEFYNGNLYESTGQAGKSFIKKFEPNSTTTVLKKEKLDDTIFGEGITILKDTIYQLTYQSKILIKYDAKTFKQISTLPWKYGEGWGLTNNGKELIASNGTSTIFFLNPSDLTLQRSINVNNNGNVIDQVNELEFVDNFIYANQFTTDNLYKIDATNGNVVAMANFKNLLPGYDAETIKNKGGESFFNGIAYNTTTKTFYITGKNWPKIFEIKL